ncbi:uncharacterized protein LOC122392865 [Amphibalanus amphitrite]|uniref:uncharacterized protein LOC122392865 n=1 Tax=Amphibalanus amphitrite TaxID=1232801 RepID=UPI001C91AE3C|nr:uncharacterized protein LOC122392865 [Amphibalanus amphitrite]
MDGMKKESKTGGGNDAASAAVAMVGGYGSGLMLAPPVFTKDSDPTTFFSAYRRTARANGWPLERQLDLLPALFAGEVSWVADDLDRQRPTSLEEAEVRVRALVWPRERQQVSLHRFYEAKMKKTDEPRTFVTQLRSLLKGGMPDIPDDSRERMIMEHLPRAVPSEWQLKLLDSDATTVEAYVRRLERLKTSEQLAREMQEEQTRSAVPVRSVAEPRRSNSRGGLCFRCGRRGHFAAACRGPPLSAPVSESRQGAGPSEPRQGAGSASCFFCGQSGHLVANCPQKGQPAQRQPVKCFRCGGLGHFSRQCPSDAGANRQGGSRRTDVRRVTHSRVSELRCIVEAEGKTVAAVVDTGSTVSLIRAALVSDLCLELSVETAPGLVAANGTEVEVLGTVVVKLSLAGKENEHELYVVEDLTDSLLLGLDAPKKWKERLRQEEPARQLHQEHGHQLYQMHAHHVHQLCQEWGRLPHQEKRKHLEVYQRQQCQKAQERQSQKQE